MSGRFPAASRLAIRIRYFAAGRNRVPYSVTKICVTRKNDALVVWQGGAPSRAARDLTNSFREIAIVQGRCVRIEAREFLKLHGGAAKHETPPRVTFLLR